MTEPVPVSNNATIKDLQARVNNLEAQMLQLNMIVRNLANRIPGTGIGS